MAQAVSCNYSRTAIRILCQREFISCGAVKELSRASIDKVVQEYNELFSEQGPSMNLSIANIYKKIPSLLTTFNKKWHPQSQKSIFLDVFSLNAWTHLSQQEKNMHTLEQCSACQTWHSSLTKAFPAKNQPKRRLPVIEFCEPDLVSPSSLGKKALRELNNICEENFDKSVQEVITESPRSNLVKKSSGRDVQSEMRKTIRSTKKTIQQSMDESSLSTVMGNRLSWRKFDEMRKSETLQSNTSPNSTPTRKRKRPLSDENSPSKRKHGSPSTLSKTVEEDLLREAQTWSDDEKVNWSHLAREHGITEANGGQTIKEFLNHHNIPAASSKQREEREHRRKRKTLPRGIPFPMHRPSSFHKKELAEQVETGQIVEGVPVVPASISGFRYEKSANKVVSTNSTVYARKIPLSSIRKSLLEEHEKLGIIRQLHTSEGESCPADMEATRFLKVWHDHSSIAGHGHFLVLVSVIYDTAFCLTQKEANSKLKKEIDIQSTVEAPAIHILGRSSSSVEDQALFSETRNECLSTLDTPLTLSDGMKVRDIVRFFHGDGPAQQFEAGNSIGGNYCCVGCGVKSDRNDDIAYAYRCQKLDLQQRQEFLLQGVVWKKIGTRPLDKLLLSDLKAELSLRGVPIAGKKKPILEKDFEEIRTGISNFPALLQEQHWNPSTYSIMRYRQQNPCMISKVTLATLLMRHFRQLLVRFCLRLRELKQLS